MKEQEIKDIPSFRQSKTEIQGIKTLATLLQITPIIRKKESAKKSLKDLEPKINDRENQVRELCDTPDLYNQHFCSNGWIAHESLDIKIMLLAIRFAEQGKMTEAEEVLLSYYTSENLSSRLIRFRHTEPFSKRIDIIEQAIEDYKTEQFSSCVLYLLITIDGVVNDIENTGFFANKTDLSAWDSIAGHSSGLGKLKKLFSQKRVCTNIKEIFIPYRNGILHGRDINFNNKHVAAKCWSALIATYDWAMALKNKGRTEPQKVPEPGFIETIIEILEDCSQMLEEIDKTNTSITK